MLFRANQFSWIGCHYYNKLSRGSFWKGRNARTFMMCENTMMYVWLNSPTSVRPTLCANGASYLNILCGNHWHVIQWHRLNACYFYWKGFQNLNAGLLWIKFGKGLGVWAVSAQTISPGQVEQVESPWAELAGRGGAQGGEFLTQKHPGATAGDDLQHR